jgi:hypothetical protein
MSLVASSLPGRLRLRDRSLREPALLERTRKSIAGWKDVQAVEANPRAGSLLVRYDADRLPQASVEARARAAMERMTGKGTARVGVGGTAAQARQKSGTLRVRANRWAKRGMLASLGVSLALALAGSKRWHALTGVLFLHALGVHLWVHRRHLLR